jgi:hypothetical protein
VHSEDVQAELDELCELWGVEKRGAPDNEHPKTRDKRLKLLRDLFVKRKAERLKAIEASGHARVVAAAGRPGAVERPDGVTALAGQTFAASAIERAGGRVTGVRVFPAASGSSGVLISVEFLEPAAAPPDGAAGAGAAGAAGAEASGAGASASDVGAVAAAGGAPPPPPPALPPTPLASPRPPRLARDSGDPAPDSWDSDCPNSYPSWLDRAWVEAVGDVHGEGLAARWMMRRSLARACGVPFSPDMRESSSPRPNWHPPGCPCGRPTCPIPVEDRISRMEI